MEAQKWPNYLTGSQPLCPWYACVNSYLLNVNFRLMGMHLLARDLLMLLCQDENRNHSRKYNAAKKERGEEVKLGRRKISEGIWCLAFLINRCSQDVKLPLFGNIDSEYISKPSSTYPTAASHSTICSSQFCCASCTSSSSPSTPSYSSHFS